MAAGSTHLVVGRPVTQADEPMAALAAIARRYGPFAARMARLGLEYDPGA